MGLGLPLELLDAIPALDWKLCTIRRGSDGHAGSGDGASGCDSATVLHMPAAIRQRYVAAELAAYIEASP
jgi:hypothetical protein